MKMPPNKSLQATRDGANAGWRSQFRFRGSHHRSPVAQLESLIWLEFVKQAVVLLSESFHYSSGLRHRGFSDSEAGTL